MNILQWDLLCHDNYFNYEALQSDESSDIMIS